MSIASSRRRSSPKGVRVRKSVQENLESAPAATMAASVVRRPIGLWGLFWTIALIVTSVLYFSYRIPLWNPAAPILSSMLLAAEAFGMVGLGLHMLMTWTVVERRAAAPPPDMEADILVTTWNEPVELLRQTLIAARRVRLARQVWLLDDGARPEMRALAEELGVRYVARVERDDAKAGNLNNALRVCDARFIAIFDCDHVPSTDFLEKTLGYFTDDKVAFVQTPQDFYNLDSIQHRLRKRAHEVWHEQSLFYRVIQPGKDRWNAAFFCGSCAVMRREALDDVGGFATGTITEDLHTSVRMHKHGWRSVFHSEPLAFGLSPFSMSQYATQRLRWGRGAMQVWRKERFMLGGKMNLAQWACYLASTMTYFEGWQKLSVYLLPPLILLTGSLPLKVAGWTFLLYFIPWIFSGIMVSEVFGRGYAKTLWMEEYNFLRYFTFIRATVALLIPGKLQFQVTSKQRGTGRAMLARLAPQLAIIVLTAGSIVAGIYFYLYAPRLPVSAFWISLAWAVFNLSLAVRALGFAISREQQRRDIYRFPVPVPVAVKAADGNRLFLVADNLSTCGLGLTAPAGPLPGDVIEGEMLLPQGAAPFWGHVVRHVESDGRAVIGLRFVWSDVKARDRLSEFLYGNPLQWDVNDWADGGRSMLARLMLRSRRPEEERADWRPAVLSSADGQAVDCLARPMGPKGDDWRIVSYDRPQAGAGLRLVSSNGGDSDLVIGDLERMDAGSGEVFIMRLNHGRTFFQPAMHSRPAWARGLVPSTRQSRDGVPANAGAAA